MSTKKKKKQASEIEFLRWFYVNSDFGPADFDVRESMLRDFTESTGKELPEGYELEDEEEA